MSVDTIQIEDEFNENRGENVEISELKRFKVDRPFFVIIQHKVDDKVIILLVAKVEKF